MVRRVIERWRTSERYACRALGFHRSTHRYESVRRDSRPLRLRIKEIALARPRFGYRRIWVLLRREGWDVNHKLVYRIYKEEGLEVRSKRRKKRASHTRVPLPSPERRNEQWALDFVSDTLESGRRYRALTVIDLFSRECVAIEVAFKMTSEIVATVLERAIRQRRQKPKSLTVDNGPEFRSNYFDAWAYSKEIQLDFIRPGRPVENAFIESFNGSLRDECLNAEWFGDIGQAAGSIEAWRIDYNEVRPHSSLGHLPPARYLAGGRHGPAGHLAV